MPLLDSIRAAGSRLLLVPVWCAMLFGQSPANAGVDVGGGPTCGGGSSNSSFTDPVSVSVTDGNQHAEAVAILRKYLYAQSNAYASGLSCRWGGSASDSEQLRIIGLQFNQTVTLTVTTSFTSELQDYSNTSNAWSNSDIYVVLGAGLGDTRVFENETFYYGIASSSYSSHIVSHSFTSSEWSNLYLAIGANAWGAGAAGAATSISAGAPNGNLFRVRLSGPSSNLTGLSYQIGNGPVLNLSASVPEPSQWVMMMFGFGLAGTALRRRTLAIAN